MENKIFHALTQLENVKAELSKTFNKNFENLKQYLNEDNPIVYVLSTNSKLLRDFNESYIVSGNDNFKIFQFNTEEVTSGNSDVFIKEISNKAIFSDYILILTTALRIAPSGIHSIMDSLKRLNKITFIFICEFQQLPQNDETIKRKVSEAGKLFDLKNVKCFACSNERNPKTELLKPLPEALTIFKELVKESFEKVRCEQSEKLIKHVYDLALKEAFAIKDRYLTLKSFLNEERQIAHSTIEGIKIVSNSVTSEFSSLKESVYASINEITWEKIKAKMMNEKNAIPEGEAFIEELIRILNEEVEDSIKKIKQLQKKQISNKLEQIIQDAKITLERNYQALFKVAGIGSELLSEMKNSIYNEAIFDKVRHKCMEFEETYVQLIENEVKKNITLGADDIRLKILNSIKSLKNTIVFSNVISKKSKYRNDIEGTSTPKTNSSNIAKCFDFMIDKTFDAVMNGIISSVINQLVEYAEAVIDNGRNVILNMLKESIDQYCQSFISCYPRFATENENRFSALNNFIDNRVVFNNVGAIHS